MLYMLRTLAITIFFLSCAGVPLHLHSFPTRRSSDLPARVPLRGALGLGRRSEGHQGPRGGCAHPPVGREPRPGESGRRSEEHTSELQSRFDLVCRLLLEKKKQTTMRTPSREHQESWM